MSRRCSLEVDADTPESLSPSEHCQLQICNAKSRVQGTGIRFLQRATLRSDFDNGTIEESAFKNSGQTAESLTTAEIEQCSSFYSCH
ncbi:putative Synaptobrevin [Fusarium oxysporum f. sp. albedinis]|nr:putative Synaptobrevin [Fusarium oxysporum f. sp. albedinis]